MKKTAYGIGEILEEIEELEANQHPSFYKNEPKGRERMAFLLLALNDVEEDETKNHITTTS